MRVTVAAVVARVYNFIGSGRTRKALLPYDDGRYSSSPLTVTTRHLSGLLVLLLMIRCASVKVAEK
jgi:hypothetical protein